MRQTGGVKMDNEFGNDFYTVVDENGLELTLEHLGTMQVEDHTYMAFLPADMDEDNPDFGIVLLEVVDENGEDVFATIDEDDVRDTVYELFMAELFAEEDDGE